MAEAYPIPSFSFKVDFGGTTMACSAVSGLSVSVQELTYRDGFSSSLNKQTLAGLPENSQVTLRKGVFKNDTLYYDWYNETTGSEPSRMNVTISLLDAAGDPVMVWNLKNAWPMRVTSPDMSADGNEVAVETIELSHEGITISKG
ncbi:MAG: phage tail protein [Bacteroidota bacterium]